MPERGEKSFAFSPRRGECLIVNPIRQIEDDTKDKNTRWEEEVAVAKLGIPVETPEEFMEKLHHQATDLGPVMAEILRATQEREQSHWGLNE
jgi:hypothetical protein